MKISSINNVSDMSFTQKRTWLLQKQFNASYKSGICFKLYGKLDLHLLNSQLSKLVAQYDIINSELIETDASLMYPSIVDRSDRIIPSPIFSDISQLSSERKKQLILSNWKLQISSTPEDVTTLETMVFKESDLEQTLMITVPAIFADSQSLLNIITEMVEHYSCEDSGKTAEDHEIFQFTQFVDWQNDLIANSNPAAAKTWASRSPTKNKFSIPLENNVDRSNSLFYTLENIVELDTQKVKNWCSTNNCTVELFLLSVWTLMLWNYMGKTDSVSVGKSVSGRSLDYFGKMVGPFSKTLPLRLKIDEKHTFLEICRIVQAEIEVGEEWQDNFAIEFDIDGTLVTSDYNFDYQKNTGFRSENSDLSAQVLMIHSFTDWFKLKLLCTELNDSMDVRIFANEAFYSSMSVKCIAEHFKSIVNEVLDSTNFPVELLCTISPWENELVTKKFNDTRRSFKKDCSLIEFIEEQAVLNRNAIALKYKNIVYNWQEFNEKANQWANLLSKQYKISTGDVVAICLERSPLQIILLLGILKTGAAYLPLDHNTPVERIKFILEDSNAKIIVSENNLSAINISEVLQLWVADDETFVSGLSVHFESVKRSAEDIFYVMYTSGSTGKPKGVLVHDQAIINYTLWFQSEHQITNADSSVLFSSIAFDLSYTALWPILVSGGGLNIAVETPVFDPENLLHILVNEKVTYIKLTPSHFNLLINCNGFQEMAGSLSLRLVALGGEAIKAGDIELYARAKSGTVFINHYGPTETTVGVISHKIDLKNIAAFKQRPLIGKPISNNRIYIVDENNKMLPPGFIGEICIAGENVAKGYLRQSVLTDEKFVKDFFAMEGKVYMTGDLGRWTSGGEIEFFGRRDFQVKLHGYRIELGEIELVMQSFTGIKKVFATTADQGASLLAFFTAEGEVNIKALKQFIGDRLPNYMLPGTLMQVPEFPLVANGKIDRSQLLKSTDMQGPNKQTVQPKTTVEMQLAELWQNELQTDQFSITDNFFDIGGNSFKLVGVFQKISLIYPSQINLTDLFKYNTVQSLAAYMESKTQLAKSANHTALSFEV